MERARIVVTGIGAVTALGNLDQTWQGVLDGRIVAARPSSRKPHDEQVDYPVVPIPDDVLVPGGKNAWQGLDESSVSWDRSARLAVIAAGDALEMAGISENSELCRVTGVALGTARSTEWTRQQHSEMAARGEPLPRDACLASMFASPAHAVARHYRLAGPNLTVTASCVSAAHALILAMQQLQCGTAERMVVAGTEACLTPSYIRQLGDLGILTRHACRPFDAGRDGTWLGEGAGALVVETETHARSRSAIILAEIVAADSIFDGSAKTKKPSLSLAIDRALRFADLSPNDVHYVNAHGTGTAVGDAVEGRAIARSFGDHARQLHVDGFKAVIGHTIGASAAVELALIVRGMQEGIFPGTANCSHPDRAFPFRVATDPVALRHPIVLKTTSGLGGVHAACLLRSV